MGFFGSRTSSVTQSSPIAVARNQPQHVRSSSGPSSSHTSSSLTRPTTPVTTEMPKIHLRLVPHVDYANPSFVFDVVERQLTDGSVLQLGRCSKGIQSSSILTFDSYVVSRDHAEIWCQNGKLYLRDLGSSCGTLVNQMCLPRQRRAPGLPCEIRDGDVIQLGTDYQNAREPKYRAVRMRVDIMKQPRTPNTLFQHQAFQSMQSQRKISPLTKDDIQECCICLYAMAPSQALFVAPCAHMFHFKCLYPYLGQHYPAFSCPMCRSYANLEDNVAVEVDEVLAQLDTLTDTAASVASSNHTPQGSPPASSCFLKRPTSTCARPLDISPQSL